VKNENMNVEYTVSDKYYMTTHLWNEFMKVTKHFLQIISEITTYIEHISWIDCRIMGPRWPPAQQPPSTALYPWTYDERVWRHGHNAVADGSCADTRKRSTE